MFGINKKIKEMQKDPKKAIDEADKTLNKGFTGFMTKTFLGKDAVNQMNKGLDAAKQYSDYNNISQTGMGATAEVLTLEDTGALVNFNPVVRMKLKVQPQFGMPFETTAEAAVSKIAVPRVGDKINIKYNPVNTSEIVVI
ncbi:MAG TPA: hypothetical protein VJ455_05910 [Ignavibacteria bacterium]|nr:hypothetical protein [Ignavibacteria bacterium]